MDMDPEDSELRNPFPSPPSAYKNYTSHNMRLLTLLNARHDPDSVPAQAQEEVLADQKNVPSFDLHTLEPPRVDWVLEEGHYSVFGESWMTSDRIQTLKEAGGTQLFPEDPSIDRRPALQAILRTLLASYTNLLSAVVQPPLTTSDWKANREPEWTRHSNWIYVMGQNIMAAANEMRPAQARANVEGLLRRQLELRREETKKLHERCDSLEQTLAALQLKSAGLLDKKRAALSALSETEQSRLDLLAAPDPSAMLLVRDIVSEAISWNSQTCRTMNQ